MIRALKVITQWAISVIGVAPKRTLTPSYRSAEKLMILKAFDERVRKPFIITQDNNKSKTLTAK